MKKRTSAKIDFKKTSNFSQYEQHFTELAIFPAAVEQRDIRF